MEKILDLNGDFTKEGKLLIIDLEYGLNKLMSSDQVFDMSQSDLLMLENRLISLMKEVITNKINKKQQCKLELDKMSDDEAISFLKEKYGSAWPFCSLTEEEHSRARPLIVQYVENAVTKWQEIHAHLQSHYIK